MVWQAPLASSSYLAMEIYATVRPGQSQALLSRARAWIDTHTDQVIIAGSLIAEPLWVGRSQAQLRARPSR
jgi:hypothetical protein